MSFWCFSHSGEIFVYLFICSLWFCIQVLKREAFITFYDKTPGVAPEGQGTLRASTLQGCGPDTETRMNDTWHVVCCGPDFTSPEVRTFQEALLLSPGNSQINGDLMVRQSQVTSSHCFHGEPPFWRVFVSLTPYLRCRWLVGSCEMMKRTSLRESTRTAMFPCVQVLMGVVLRPPEPNGTGEMFQNKSSICVWFVFQVGWKLKWWLLILFIELRCYHMLLIDNLIPDMLTDLNPFEAFIDSFHCRSQAAGWCTKYCHLPKASKPWSLMKISLHH